MDTINQPKHARRTKGGDTPKERATKLCSLLNQARYAVWGLEFTDLLRLTGLKVIELAQTIKALIDSGHVEIVERRNNRTFYRIKRS